MENNNMYQINGTQFNVKRVFSEKYKLEDIVKRLIASKLNDNCVTDFTNGNVCDIISHE